MRQAKRMVDARSTAPPIRNINHAQRLTCAGEVTAQIAHQLTQPLTAIVNFAGGLAARVGNGALEPDTVREVATRIADEARRASHVVRSLRAFLRNGECITSAADLNVIVRRACGVLDDEFRREAVVVGQQLSPDLPSLCLDATLIEQVILNLIRNALDAVTGWQGARRVDISTEVTPTTVTLSIADSGVGLPAQDSDRIFEAFYTTKPSGLGLGLSISRSIIEASGGRLWAEPRTGGGTIVAFTLPRRGTTSPRETSSANETFTSKRFRHSGESRNPGD